METAQHAVIMADGTLPESYLDTGNRRVFRQAGTVVRIPGLARCWAEDAAAPLMTAREAVEPLHRRLAQRAETLRTAQSEVSGVQRDEAELLPDAATLTTDPDLHLVTEDGAVLRKARTHNGCVVFMVPPHVRAVRLVSRASRPVDTIGPFVDDRRMLGVLIGRMMVQEGAAETGQAARWTNGHAALALGARQPGALGLLSIEVLAGGPYRVNSQSAALSRAVS
ncbi:hypothetical protein [Acetobacter cerevisiae]|uniref:hypothetical protein n=1 Tax=Acetobacter cerevisiae TaxID=178900 RepID=UPI0020A08065|nr:hypothetical protein [Acetobacter cerevisiae]MCP1270264.1 hypothetical protein [Acetobacter cerevisiae]MCP1278217.1 hypothetical protein [Acetobacter cerevisiae]